MTTALKQNELCPNCESLITVAAIRCEVCEEPVGFPNVRLAEKESATLQSKYEDSLASIDAREIRPIIDIFEDSLQSARVVVAKSLDSFIATLNSGNQLITTFYNQVASNARLAENNDWDPYRPAIESVCHPLYYTEIQYAALSLDGYGASKYGGVHITLKQGAIEKRTSFFIENPFDLISKIRLPHLEPLPAGYRSTWSDKSKLAVCKLHSKFEAKTTSDDFPKILLDWDKDDFIEANIYGRMHRGSFESITYFGLEGSSEALLKANMNKHKDLGITINSPLTESVG